MPKKKREDETEEVIEQVIEQPVDEVPAEIVAETIPEEAKEVVAVFEKPYEAVEWKSGIYVQRCKICQLDLNEEDDMILHILNHFPKDQHQSILDTLVKE